LNSAVHSTTHSTIAPPMAHPLHDSATYGPTTVQGMLVATLN